MGFCLSVCLYVDYMCQFGYFEPSLHFWDEAYLVMVADLFAVFLESVCKYLLRILGSIHKGNWSVILFLYWALMWFMNQGKCDCYS